MASAQDPDSDPGRVAGWIARAPGAHGRRAEDRAGLPSAIRGVR